MLLIEILLLSNHP